MYYADNPTLPYMDSWLAVQETAKIAGVDLTVEAIPSTDYNTKVSLALNMDSFSAKHQVFSGADWQFNLKKCP